MSTYRTVTVKAIFQNNTISPDVDFKSNMVKEKAVGLHSGDVLPSDDLPLMNGEASAGISKKYSRGDHRHPHDDEKMNYISAITNLELEEMLQ